MSNLEVTIYQRPDGRRLRTIITDVDSDDAAFFKKHGVIIGMEEVGNLTYAVYARFPHQDEEDELIVLSGGRTCNGTLREVREQLEASLES